MNRALTCCFAGHRRMPREQMEHIIKRLNHEIENLIEQGVVNYISGGALGFDQIAASLIVAKKEMGRAIRLVFSLACKNQDALWNDAQKRLYRNLLAEADEVIYVSEMYDNECMKKRNRYMVDRSAYCICALLRSYSGTHQTVKYARQEGLRIVNIADASE